MLTSLYFEYSYFILWWLGRYVTSLFSSIKHLKLLQGRSRFVGIIHSTVHFISDLFYWDNVLFMYPSCKPLRQFLLFMWLCVSMESMWHHTAFHCIICTDNGMNSQRVPTWTKSIRPGEECSGFPSCFHLLTRFFFLNNFLSALFVNKRTILLIIFEQLYLKDRC